MPVRRRLGDAYHRPAAFTLLELLLATALTVILLGLIGAAIDFHWRQLTVRKTGVEQTQLAQAILQQIADDILSVAVAADLEGVSAIVSDSELEDEQAEAVSDGTTDASSDESVTSVEDPLASLYPELPGLYGSSLELQIDVVRVPRPEEYDYQYEVVDPTTIGLPGDMKTITYTVMNGGMLGGSLPGQSMPTGSGSLSTGITSGARGDPLVGSSAGNATSSAGLIRRVTDRSSARYAIENGDLALLEGNLQRIAPEVIALTFAYFDGTQWLTEWNTEELGSLPLAVEITLVMQVEGRSTSGGVPSATLTAVSTTAGGPSEAGATGLLSLPPGMVMYRRVVHLPASTLLTTAEQAMVTTTDTEVAR